MSRLVVVSNRTPPPPKGKGRAKQAAGGLAVGMKDAIAGRETLWFGWSGETAAEPGPPRQVTVGQLTLATVDLSAAEYDGFYRGFSNGMLWPVLHGRIGLATFRRDDLAAYLAVNEVFARGLAPLLRPDDVIWVQDYHLIPLGQALRGQGVRNRIGFFLHVPFPPPASFDDMPRAEDLLRAMGAYDLIGLQTRPDAVHLNESLTPLGLAPRAAAFAIGIDPVSFAADAARAATGQEVRRLAASMGERALVLGVDRLDYTKGLPQRFHGFAQLLRRFPEHRRHVTLLQVAPVSRGDVAQYRALRRELDGLVGRINGDYAEVDWAPIRYITRAVARQTLAGMHRLARVGLITPLRDGMNLVALEYVAAQDPAHPGALVLSRFAGAAELLDGALLVNPHDPDETAEALHTALTMPQAERRERWTTMNRAVQKNTAAAWAHSFLAALEEPTKAAA
jgi:trehalose 6-phosphate synthase